MDPSPKMLPVGLAHFIIQSLFDGQLNQKLLVITHSVPFIVFHPLPNRADNKEVRQQGEDLCTEGGGPVALRELFICCLPEKGWTLESRY